MRGIREIRAGFFRSAGILVLTASAALAQGVNFALPAQPLSDSLKAVAQQTGQNILFTPQAVAGLVAPELHGQMSGRDAVNALIKGTNLGADPDGNGGLIVHVLGSDRAAIEQAIAQTRRSAAPLTLPVTMTVAGGKVTGHRPATQRATASRPRLGKA